VSQTISQEPHMRVAVTSQNFRTITGHAGKTRRFLVFEADPAGAPREVERLDLPSGMSLHDYHGPDHPLFALGLDALITLGAGQGFIGRLARAGIAVHATSETDPMVAVAAVSRGAPLPPAEPHTH
jgi:predicted Fe-Mo cluster-binding NifX family protein